MILPSHWLGEENTMEVFVTRHAGKEGFLFVAGPHSLLKSVNVKLPKPIEKTTTNDPMKLEPKNTILRFPGYTLFVNCQVVAVFSCFLSTAVSYQRHLLSHFFQAFGKMHVSISPLYGSNKIIYVQ